MAKIRCICPKGVNITLEEVLINPFDKSITFFCPSSCSWKDAECKSFKMYFEEQKKAQKKEVKMKEKEIEVVRYYGGLEVMPPGLPLYFIREHYFSTYKKIFALIKPILLEDFKTKTLQEVYQYLENFLYLSFFDIYETLQKHYTREQLQDIIEDLEFYIQT